MREEPVPSIGEVRDSLDERWHKFLASCNSYALLLPNDRTTAAALIQEFKPAAFVLTGGGNIQAVTDHRTNRDEIESLILNIARNESCPVIGICRGLQVLIADDGVDLYRVSGHVKTNHSIHGEINRDKVNSFHEYGTQSSLRNYDVVARSTDGVVEMIRHRSLPWVGIGWHPEREAEFSPEDVELFRAVIHQQGKR